MEEIRFPKQFEFRRSSRPDFLDDHDPQPWMNVPRPPAIITPIISAELLDKHNRLWVLKPGVEKNPTLYEAGLFPQRRHHFFATAISCGSPVKPLGYPGFLKTHELRKFGLADAFDFNNRSASAVEMFLPPETISKSPCMMWAQARWTYLPLPPASLSSGTRSPFLSAGNKQSLGYVAGSVLIHDTPATTLTNLANLNSVQQMLRTIPGFLSRGWDGLHFMSRPSRPSETLTAPGVINSLFISMMGSSSMGNSESRSGDLEKMAEQIEGRMRKLQPTVIKIMRLSPERIQGSITAPDWRVPGEVTAFAIDGDFLARRRQLFWQPSLLLHKPSNSRPVARCRCATKSPVWLFLKLQV